MLSVCVIVESRWLGETGVRDTFEVEISRNLLKEIRAQTRGMIGSDWKENMDSRGFKQVAL